MLLEQIKLFVPHQDWPKKRKREKEQKTNFRDKMKDIITYPTDIAQVIRAYYEN